MLIGWPGSSSPIKVAVFLHNHSEFKLTSKCKSLSCVAVGARHATLASSMATMNTHLLRELSVAVLVVRMGMYQ